MSKKYCYIVEIADEQGNVIDVVYLDVVSKKQPDNTKLLNRFIEEYPDAHEIELRFIGTY